METPDPNLRITAVMNLADFLACWYYLHLIDRHTVQWLSTKVRISEISSVLGDLLDFIVARILNPIAFEIRRPNVNVSM